MDDIVSYSWEQGHLGRFAFTVAKANVPDRLDTEPKLLEVTGAQYNRNFVAWYYLPGYSKGEEMTNVLIFPKVQNIMRSYTVAQGVALTQVDPDMEDLQSISFAEAIGVGSVTSTYAEYFKKAARTLCQRC